MVPLDFEDRLMASKDAPPFSNGSQVEEFTYNECGNCIHEVECPLIDIAYLGRTPVEWTPVNGSYMCTIKQPSRNYL